MWVGGIRVSEISSPPCCWTHTLTKPRGRCIWMLRIGTSQEQNLESGIIKDLNDMERSVRWRSFPCRAPIIVDLEEPRAERPTASVSASHLKTVLVPTTSALRWLVVIWEGGIDDSIINYYVRIFLATYWRKYLHMILFSWNLEPFYLIF